MVAYCHILKLEPNKSHTTALELKRIYKPLQYVITPTFSLVHILGFFYSTLTNYDSPADIFILLFAAWF